MRSEDAGKIARLDAFIRQHGLEFAIVPADPDLGGFDAVVLIISASQQDDLRITVFDEYGDARPDNPALCLALLNMQFRELADAQGRAQSWAIAEGLDPAAPQTRAGFIRNEAGYAAFRAAYGPIPDVVTDLDWQLNAGLVQALRAL
tara:strand:- start:2540 stop:2980 length:441 start_codon:yes stop_codon:yes gene_type:complete